MVALVPMNLKGAQKVVRLFSKDARLRSDLGITRIPNDPAKELHFIRQWEKSTHGQTYQIVNHGQFVGTISLSHQCLESKSAGIGYWIGSDYRRKGYASQALDQIIHLGRQKGIHRFSAKIDPENAGSLKLWQNREASLILLESGMIQASLTFRPSSI